jgi:hypothetical protein
MSPLRYDIGGERLVNIAKLGLRLINTYLRKKTIIETVVICDLFTGLWQANFIYKKIYSGCLQYDIYMTEII